MTVEQAQLEMRTAYVNGAVGQAVSGVLWLASAAAATWASTRLGILVLVAGGAFIFPLTVATLKLTGRRGGTDRSNPLNALARQVAFSVPLLVPLAGAAALHRLEWFYPGMMLIVGVHYLPFVFLYGMRAFYALAAALILGGVMLGLGPGPLSDADWTAGAWATGTVILAFAVGIGRLTGGTSGTTRTGATR